ncbi:MAG: stage II sporulation protein M [Chitinophagales bacterium]|nr:stage II sporulation protein M [Chitinophagales bacterium]MDW8417780.1 stage II sporulation protein M [Chitinophagales bacterium]
MREALFIKKNKDRWEKIRQSETTDVDTMSSYFTQMIEDLSYARTFYPKSATTRYINSIAARYYLRIYRNTKHEASHLSRFFTVDLPLAVYRFRYSMLFTLVTFVIFTAAGFYSARTDSDFVKEVLGADYVMMTEENISKGQPFGVYASGDEIWMWLGIFFNNIKVSFVYFAGSLFVGLPFFLDVLTGTQIFGVLGLYGPFNLIHEGMRLGAFEYMFYHHGLGLEAVLTVMIHGTLELSAIVLAGGAGLGMGLAFLFPGTYSRMRSFRSAATDGVRVIIGLIPVFCMAAFFEGFITRYADMPVALKWIILLLSAAYVIGYFGIYPVSVHQKQKKHPQT